MVGFYSNLEYDINLDLEADPGAPAPAPSPAPLVEVVSGADVPLTLDGTTVPPPSQSPQTQKPYLSKRPHRKSRAGCKQCKKRKVKCDEAKPSCKACTLRKEECVYPTSQPSSGTRPSPTSTTGPLVVRSREKQSPEECVPLRESDLSVVSEPLFLPEQASDVIDLKMLWFYTTYSFQSFSVQSGRSAAVDYALKIKIVEYAFRSPFLLDTVKGVAALHLRNLGQPVPAHKVASYQSAAFRGYRTAIEAANPVDFPALLACSLFMVAMSSQQFRDPGGKRLFVVEWIAMWRGIGLIVDLITPQVMHDSGLATLFYRPPIDLERAAQHIPNNLLFMVTSTKPGDEDYEYQKDYYELLRYLGALYMELKEHGFGPVLDLRIITFFSFCPRPLLPLAKEHRPRMLVIIAHWICFIKLLNIREGWWMKGLWPHISQILEEVSEGEYSQLLRVPQTVLLADEEDKTGMARLIVDNHDWTRGYSHPYSSSGGSCDKHRDYRTLAELKFIQDEEPEAAAADGYRRARAPGVESDAPSDMDDAATAADENENQGLLLGTGSLYNPTPRGTSSSSVRRPPIQSPPPSSSSSLAVTMVSP
ncbi:hypothetical protein F5Y17DRAFT_111013 [Xylariaceae sp. FL0594]|nr:hypothetical protein F5Y17DRAFT_111013 [Xylariaceae sp. FL0594]